MYSYLLNHLRVTGWLDKVQADMHSHINNTLTTGLLFLSHIILVLVIKEINNGNPTMTIINIITKPRGVNNSQFNLEHFFFQFYPFEIRIFFFPWLISLYFTCSCNLNLNSLGRCLCTSLVQVFRFLDGRSKQRIDKCCLSYTRLTFFVCVSPMLKFISMTTYHKPSA